MVDMFAIHQSVPLGSLKLEEPAVSRSATAMAPWGAYIMEPNTESTMHEHFVVQNGNNYGFRWIICLSPGSIPGKHGKSHLVCTRELIWCAPSVAD